MLDSAIKEQLRTIFAALEANYTFDITVSPQHESRTELLELLNDVASCSEKLSCRINEGKGLEFTLLKGEHRTGITFRAVPNGHEFSSLLLAILNTDGKGKNFPDEGICNRVKSLKGPVRLTTYVSLTCTNCPDVVQALNAMTTLNGQIQHQTVDGAINQAEVEALKIQGVPSVFADGKLIHVGRGKAKVLTAKGGERFSAPAVIVATGASWRKLNVPGEAEYIGRGVAFCPHCDGPFYKGKQVAVVGGGNSGIEAAIDLAGICSKVTVLEFMDELKADQVLQEKLKSLPNVEVLVHSQTTEVVGNGDKVTGIRVKDRKTEEERVISLDGIFVQIGLVANSGIFRDVVEVNRPGEIVIDAHCRTNVPGIYAAGDVSTVPYKQIIIAMGEGAKAALAAFEDRMRGEI